MLTIDGAISAAAVSLTGASVTIAGLVTDGGAGTVNLIATGGTIDESGTLVAGTLSGGATGTATLTGAMPTTNQIATVGSFSAAGITVNDGTGLAVAGLVNGGAVATITDNALLTITGTVFAASVALTGANVAIPGLVSDGGAGTVGLIATSGTINEPGTLIAGTLTGRSTGATTLTGATPITNQVAMLGGFTADGFLLNDGEALSVAGTLNGGESAAIVDSALLTIGGTVNAGSIALTGAALSIPGLVTDGGAGSVELTATAGSINKSGTLIAGTLSGSATGATTLLGATPTTNQVETLVAFNSAGFIMNDGKSLTVSVIANGDTAVTVNENALLTIDGTVSATSGESDRHGHHDSRLADGRRVGDSHADRHRWLNR